MYEYAQRIAHAVRNEHFSCSFPVYPISHIIHHSVYIAWFWTHDTVTYRWTCQLLALLKYRIDTVDTLDTVKSKTLLRMEITVTKSCEILQTSHMSHMWESWWTQIQSHKEENSICTWTWLILHSIQNEHFLCSLRTYLILRFIHHSVYIAWFWTRDTLPCHITCHIQTLLKYRFDTVDTLDTLIWKTLLYMGITYTKSCYMSHALFFQDHSHEREWAYTPTCAWNDT